MILLIAYLVAAFFGAFAGAYVAGDFVFAKLSKITCKGIVKGKDVAIVAENTEKPRYKTKDEAYQAFLERQKAKSQETSQGPDTTCNK